jgi:ABC-type transport system involved in cytochrome bd biosynthesis fused ATPase/permease subunit
MQGGSERWWRYATLLAVTGLACAMLLGGLSAWFLGSVAVAGLSAAAFTFNFHIPGALVRLFAIGRTVARYGERLAGHKAALEDQVARRVGLFATMAAAPSVRHAGWQLGDQARLADYLDDVEDMDFARLRAGLPALSLACGLAAGLVATLFIAPWALLPIALHILVCLVLARALAGHGAAIWNRVRSMRREGAQALGAVMASSVPLQAEAVWQDYCGEAMAPFSGADREMAALRRHQAWLDMLAGAFGPVAGLSVVAAAWLSGGTGSALLVPVFLAFAWIALSEAMQGASRIVMAKVRLEAAQAAMAGWSGPASDAPSATAIVKLAELSHPALQRLAPDGRKLGQPLPIRLEAGRPTVLAGPSGSGKTSMLKQIAGWLGEDEFPSDAGRISASERRLLSIFCPHDAAIMSDTVRANLFAPERGDDDLWQALDAMELGERIQKAGGLDGWITQDVLSLGEAQRLNLVRVWLSDRPVVLMDEPTEHIDREQAFRILGRLLPAMQERIVVLSSHRPVDLPGLSVIRL